MLHASPAKRGQRARLAFDLVAQVDAIGVVCRAGTGARLFSVSLEQLLQSQHGLLSNTMRLYPGREGTARVRTQALRQRRLALRALNALTHAATAAAQDQPKRKGRRSAGPKTDGQVRVTGRSGHRVSLASEQLQGARRARGARKAEHCGWGLSPGRLCSTQGLAPPPLTRRGLTAYRIFWRQCQPVRALPLLPGPLVRIGRLATSRK